MFAHSTVHHTRIQYRDSMIPYKNKLRNLFYILYDSPIFSVPLLYHENGYRLYVDIMTREIVVNYVANIELIYWSVHSAGRIRNGVTRGEGGISLFKHAASFT